MSRSSTRRGLIRICLALVTLLALPGTASAAPTSGALDALAARLAGATAIHAGFEQTKTLAALKRPLRTSGRIVVVRGAGILWRIEKPYQASYALTPETVTEIGPDGLRKVRAAREVPALANIGRVFEALFAGDLTRLDTHFTVTSRGDSERWHITLAPKPALAPFLRGIEASGGAFLETIEVSEARGDLTRIDFTQAALDQPLSDADAQLLRAP